MYNARGRQPKQVAQIVAGLLYPAVYSGKCRLSTVVRRSALYCSRAMGWHIQALNRLALPALVVN